MPKRELRLGKPREGCRAVARRAKADQSRSLRRDRKPQSRGASPGSRKRKRVLCSAPSGTLRINAHKIEPLVHRHTRRGGCKLGAPPMPHRLCPICQQSGRALDVSSNSPFGQAVDYYRCDPCGHVWTHSRADPNAPAVNVTMTPGTISSRAIRRFVAAFRSIALISQLE